MNKIKKLYTTQNMTWGKVILLAIFSALITASLNITPALKNTSFQDIAVNPECWILFAMFIVVNCKKALEASLKVFVYFLISQPLIYLVQVPFSADGFGIFRYYKYWFIITVLTLPGAAFAYLVKKNNFLSLLPVLVINGLLVYIAVGYTVSMLSDFPHHLISTVFCVLSIFFYTFCFVEGKGKRLTAFVLTALMIVGFAYFMRPTPTQSVELSGDTVWAYTVDDADVVEVQKKDNGKYTFKAKKKGYANIIFKNNKNEKREFYITVSAGSIIVNELTD